MEQQNYINSVNLNQNTDFPYLVLNIVNDNSYPLKSRFQVHCTGTRICSLSMCCQGKLKL